ncbi:MFS transporter [Chloroflexota bacterium]
MSVEVNKSAVLIITVITMFFSTFMSSSINVALPTIGQAFAMEASLISWVHTAYLLLSAPLLVPFGRLADIYGRRKFFLYGVLLLTVASFINAVSGSTALFLACRALAGIGSAMISGTSLAILTSVYPAEERGRVLGITAGAIYLGLSTGPFLGGVLTQYLGWQSIFFAGATLGLVVAILAIWKLRGEWADARGERFDLVGSIIFIVSLIVGVYGFTILPSLPGMVLVLLGLLGLLVFIRWEGKAESPVFNIGLFRRNRVFVFSNLAVLLNYIAVFSVFVLLSLYLQYNKGFSPSVAGLILLVQPAVQTIVSPIAGRLSDRFEPALVAAVGLLINCVPLVFFVFITGETALWLIVVGMIVFGFSSGLFFAPNTNAIMGSVDKKFLGVASGTAITMRQVGMTLSMGISTILFTFFIGQAEITPEYYPAFLASIKVAFIIGAALCLCGAFAQLVGRKPK